MKEKETGSQFAFWKVSNTPVPFRVFSPLSPQFWWGAPINLLPGRRPSRQKKSSIAGYVDHWLTRSRDISGLGLFPMAPRSICDSVEYENFITSLGCGGVSCQRNWLSLRAEFRSVFAGEWCLKKREIGSQRGRGVVVCSLSFRHVYRCHND